MDTYHDIITHYIPPHLPTTQVGDMAVCSVTAEQLEEVCSAFYHEHHLPLKTMVARDESRECRGFTLLYVFGIPGSVRSITVSLSLIDTDVFPSLVSSIHELFLYERKIHSFFGLIPEHAPDIRPLILHDNWPATIYPLRKEFAMTTRPPMAEGSYDFERVEGEGVYEIPVGPVHAGIIEPGHFRFSVMGEEIIKLEGRLGYVHKGIEKLFESLPMDEKVKLAERVSGDSSVGHTLAFCQAVEKLASLEVPKRALHIRTICAELERIANHLNDIGFIMLDTAFSFGGAQGARLREIVMQCNERLSKSRFLRNMIMVGGVKQDFSDPMLVDVVSTLAALEVDLKEVIAIADNSDTLIDRLKTTGMIDVQLTKDYGGVGIPARALGISRDARVDYPYASYADCKFEVVTEAAGDVQARFKVRIREVYESIAIITQIAKLIKNEQSALSVELKELQKNSMAVGIVEGWRGDIVYFIATDADGTITTVQVRDPSFLNWPLVTHAVLGNIVPDFPLINKSFNLSYSGNDL